MEANYRKYLERAAKQMVLIHRVDTLAKLILRTIIRKVQVEHAGLFLFDKKQGEYVIRVSSGQKGTKIPVGFAKLKKNDPLIRYFTDKSFALIRQDFILQDKMKSYIKTAGDPVMIDVLKDIELEFSVYQAKVFLPGFFRDELPFILFLGEKNDKKPFTLNEMGFLSVLSSQIVMAFKNASLFEDLNHQLESNKKLLLNTVTALSNAIEAKDKYTIGHTARVVQYSIDIANNLLKDDIIDKTTEEDLRISALLHDIGKIGIPENVLNKQGSLSDEERKLIDKHPLIGVDILSPVCEFESIISGVKYHHERYDGTGYPAQLSGENIPIIAAIISVADTFDAMTSDRAYRKALPIEVAVKEIQKNSGKQFNPKIVDAFVRSIKNNSHH
ncbi:HD domain-containing phosphohydrolase [Elusimicrobiota bacterium]